MKRDGDQPPALPEFAASLLAAERRRPPPSAQQRRSVWRRARATLIAGGLLAPGLWAGKVSLAAVLWAAAATGAGVVGTVTAGRWLGAGNDEGPASESAPVRPAEAPPAVPEPPGAPVVATPSVSKLVPAAAPVAAAPTPVRKVAGQPRESALIDQARAALDGGELEVARQTLDAHAVRFPSGLFQEEREALRVLTSARAGRLDDARAQALAFRQRFPGSVFLRLLDEALTGR